MLISIAVASSLDLNAQYSMWVGETIKLDASSGVYGSITNVRWNASGGYLSYSGSGLYRNVTVTQYFSGNATVECSWSYKLPGDNSYKSMRKEWTIKCIDNPVSIYPTTLTLATGQSYNLNYEHEFSNQYTSAANAYFSSDGGGGVISVTQNGKVTAKKAGQAYVNVYSKISSVSPFCLVIVREIEPTGVSLKESLTLVEGETFTLTPTLYPSGATSSYSWGSDDDSIASVNTSGTVKAEKRGKTRVWVKTSKGGYSDYCNVTVKAPPVPPTRVLLPEAVNIYNGFSTVLVPTLDPSDSGTTYSWYSSDVSVASVSSSGKVTAKSLGKTQITVTTANNLTASCMVTVTEVPDNINTNELVRLITLLNNLSKTTLNYVE